ncbi:hypothetical protein ACJX0J_015888, partial [Zea mays]
ILGFENNQYVALFQLTKILHDPHILKLEYYILCIPHEIIVTSIFQFLYYQAHKAN